MLPLACLAVACVCLLLEHSPSASARRWTSVAFLLANFCIIWISRRPVLRFDLALNPDEAMMAANAMRTRYGWLNWDIVDPITSGPLNSAILAWPYLFGGDITLYSTRLTGLFCVFGIVAFLFLAVRRISNPAIAVVAMTPCVLFFVVIKHFDFIHYSSEHFPAFLFAFAIFWFCGSFDRNGFGKLLCCAGVLGFVPFAKVQAAPIAFTVGAFVVARAALAGPPGEAAVKRVALVSCLGLLGSAIFLLPLALTGGIGDAFKSYIVQPGLRAGSGWRDHIVSMTLHVVSFRSFVLACFSGAAIAVVTCLFGRLPGPHGSQWTQSQRWTAGLTLVVLPVAYGSIAFSGRDFGHYLLLAVPVLALLCGISIIAISKAAFPGWLRIPVWQIASVIVLAGSFAGIADNEWAWGKFTLERSDNAFQRGKTVQSAHSLAWLRPTKRDSVLCWGWDPKCYVDSAMRPATRETTNENQHYGLPLIDYFRERFLKDFAASHPDFVMDMVAPGSFSFERPEVEGLATFPALRDLVAKDFTLLSRVVPPGRCPRLYVRNTRLAQLDKSLIAFSEIRASGEKPGFEAAALDDRSVVETCNDNWLLPQLRLGNVTLRFEAVSPIKTVMILNTRRDPDGGKVGSGWIRLSMLHEDKVVHQQEFALMPFPFWSVIRLEEAVAGDAIKIDVLSFEGWGGGLNEVKVYRD